MEKVILVDTDDNERGEEEKIEAHRQGKLHRAFSVILFNNNREMLLQQRAQQKYHSPLLWTNTCCGHPRPGEETTIAAKRRLKEEFGIECQFKLSFSFIYRYPFENGLTEHEFDHVYTGKITGPPDPCINEIAAFKFISRNELTEEMKKSPENFSSWFRILVPMLNHLGAW